MSQVRTYTLVCMFLAVAGAANPDAAAQELEVETYQRGEVGFTTSSCDGNPFLIEFEGVFTHTGSQTTIRMPGYYDGNDTYRINFMPTEPGAWVWATESSIDTGESPACAELHGQTGSLTATPPSIKGLLRPADSGKWQYSDGSYAIPLAFRMDVGHEDATTVEFEAAADFLADTAKGHFFDFPIDNGRGDSRCNSNPSGVGLNSDAPWTPANNPQAMVADTTYWDRLETRADYLSSRGLGLAVMFYSDDCASPSSIGIDAGDSEEKWFVRYAVARLAAYPVIHWNTAIDIVELGGQSRIDSIMNSTDGVAALDPYGHPRSSRVRGGSGGDCSPDRNFDSYGDRYACMSASGGLCVSDNQSRTMVSYFNDGPPSDVDCDADPPKAFMMEDSFLEEDAFLACDGTDKCFNRADIRRAAWKCVVSGGCGVFIRGSHRANDTGGNNDAWFLIDPTSKDYTTEDFETDLTSEAWLALVNPFVQNQLGSTYGSMVPRTDLVSGTQWYAISDSSEAKIVLWGAGANDLWDTGGGGNVTVNLTAADGGAYTARWYNPRTGVFTDVGSGNLAGLTNHVVSPPDTDDWVMLLEWSGETVPTPPEGLRAE